MITEKIDIEKILRDYKYANTSLEKTVKSLFRNVGVENDFLHDKDSEEILSKLAWMLVDYKHNAYIYGRAQLITELNAFVEANKGKLLPKSLYNNSVSEGYAGWSTTP